MPNEQSLILKMLEDGKLTAEQAVELLTTLNRSKPDHTNDSPTAERSAGEERQARLAAREHERKVRHKLQSEERQIHRTMREEERKARRLAKEPSHIPISGVNSASSMSGGLEQTILNSLQMLGIPVGAGRGFVFQREYSGQFARSSPQVSVENTNGHVRIVASPDDLWHLALKVRVRGDDAGRARATAEDLVKVSHSDRSLTIEAKRLFGQNATSDIELSLPKSIKPSIAASCTNGTISVLGLAGDDISLRTVNGRIVGESLTGKTIEAHSINGSISLHGGGSRVICRASNGRVTVVQVLSETADIDLQTVNGAVQLTLPRSADLGYQIEAQSTAGGVRVDLPNLQLLENRLRPGRKRIEAKSLDLVSKRVQQTARVRTVSGSISINSDGEVD